jgi:hypothetical protein
MPDEKSIRFNAPFAAVDFTIKTNAKLLKPCHQIQLP